MSNEILTMIGLGWAFLTFFLVWIVTRLGKQGDRQNNSNGLVQVLKNDIVHLQGDVRISHEANREEHRNLVTRQLEASERLASVELEIAGMRTSVDMLRKAVEQR